MGLLLYETTGSHIETYHCQQLNCMIQIRFSWPLPNRVDSADTGILEANRKCPTPILLLHHPPWLIIERLRNANSWNTKYAHSNIARAVHDATGMEVQSFESRMPEAMKSSLLMSLARTGTAAVMHLPLIICNARSAQMIRRPTKSRWRSCVASRRRCRSCPE